MKNQKDNLNNEEAQKIMPIDYIDELLNTGVFDPEKIKEIKSPCFNCTAAETDACYGICNTWKAWFKIKWHFHHVK